MASSKSVSKSSLIESATTQAASISDHRDVLNTFTKVSMRSSCMAAQKIP